MEMSVRFREEVLRKELKWLPDLIPPHVTDFSSKRLDLNDLAIQATHEELGNFVYRFITIFFIEENGDVLGRVGVRTVSCTHEPSWLGKQFGLRATTRAHEEEFEETVEEALLRLSPEANRVRYILHITFESATLIKVPKGTTIDEHLRQKQERARAELAEFASNV